MKRSRLNRYTPLKRTELARGTSQLKRSRLAPVSKRKPQVIRMARQRFEDGHGLYFD
jgi:hypothetical protein